MKILLVYTPIISALLLASTICTSGQTIEKARHTKSIDTLLSKSTDNPEMVLANAYNLSWAGNYNQAIKGFQRALQLGANWEESTLGLAYTYAWSGKYHLARTNFTAVLKKNEENMNAKKGIALSYLWQGNYEASIHYFDELIQTHSGDYDLLIGKGLAHLNNKDNQLAEQAFQEALYYKPESPEALQLLKTAQEAVHFLEANIWTGYSWLDENAGKFGLRGMQLSMLVSRKLRSFVKYDNSLAFDILNYVQRDKTVPTVIAGVVQEWNKTTLSQLEYGIRFLEGKEQQQLISASQVYFLPENYRLKVGGFIGFGSSLGKEGMGYISLNIPIFTTLRLEPTYYFIQPSQSDNQEHRFQLGLQFLPGTGYEINITGIYGKSAIADASGQQNIYGWSAGALIPISKVLSGQLAFRQEKGIFQNFSVLAAGLKLKLDKPENK